MDRCFLHITCGTPGQIPLNAVGRPQSKHVTCDGTQSHNTYDGEVRRNKDYLSNEVAGLAAWSLIHTRTGWRRGGRRRRCARGLETSSQLKSSQHHVSRDDIDDRYPRIDRRFNGFLESGDGLGSVELLRR